MKTLQKLRSGLPACLFVFAMALCTLGTTGSSQILAQVAMPTQEVGAVLTEVRNGEELFRNLLFDYTQETQTLLTPEQFGWGERYLKYSHRQIRFVQQGHCVFFRDNDQAEGGIGPYEVKKTVAFNGKRIKAVQATTIKGKDGGHANISTGEEPNLPTALTPHKMGYGHAQVSTTLFNPSNEVHVHGTERLDGIKCVKIIAVSRGIDNLGRERKARQECWLAVERHFIPVKTSFFASEYSDKLPYEIDQVEDWREIEPGIMIPFKAVEKVYWNEDLKRNKLTLEQTTTVTLKEASLRPNFDATLFEDVEIPQGLIVYVSEGGNIVGSYKEGETTYEPISKGRKWLLWLIGTAGVTFLAIGAWLTARKWRNSKNKPNEQARRATGLSQVNAV